MDPQRPPRSGASRPPIGRPGGAPARRRRSRRTYLVRRLVALVVVVVVVYGAVRAVGSVFGGDSTPATADGSSTTLPGGDPTSTTVAGFVDPNAPTTTGLGATSSTAPDVGRVPTAADPARIYIAGDSDAGGFAPFLEPVLQKTGVVSFTLDYKVSTGLARPDFFDWPTHFSQTIPAANPDIVIVTFGGNDGQSIPGCCAIGTDAWRTEYGKRVGQVMDLLSAGGRTLIWVGIPDGPTPDFTQRLQQQNSVVLAQLKTHPNVKFIDAWNIFTGLDGGYALWVTDPADSISKPVRQSTDGFHLNTAGEKILSFYIAQAVEDDLRARGATIPG